MRDPAALRSRSLWLDQLTDEELEPRVPLDGDTEVDVAIVGGGFTGLWTAYSLLVADPSVRVLVIEREAVGFGASGRNGGWCVGELAGGHAANVEAAGNAEGSRLTRAVMDTVDEIGRVLYTEGIDAGFAKGGVIRVARNGAQLARQREEIKAFRADGFGADDVAALGADEARRRLAATDVVGGMWYAACARVQPARLVRGLADAVERRGGRIVEDTAVVEIAPGWPAVALTDRGRVRAEVVVRATEGYTRDLDGHRRDLVPLHSLMIATEPLSGETWDAVGLAEMETFADDRRMVIYGQRTTDGRIAFGGRGAPYAFGSRIIPSVEMRAGVHAQIRETLIGLLPQLGDVTVTHRWGGVLGVPRDWRPSVGLDREQGVAWAGGYVGEGVAPSNLAGRTLADLILGRDSDLVTLPWVGHRSRRWEPEPLRWIGINGALRLSDRSDRAEDRTDRPSRLGAVVDRLL